MIIRNCDVILPNNIPVEVIKIKGAMVGRPIVELYESEADYRDGNEFKIKIYINPNDELKIEN